MLHVRICAGAARKGRPYRNLGVGALATTTAVAAPFSHRVDGVEVGRQRAASFYMREDGGVRAVQRIDLSA
jgi:hypothetical protein